MKGSIEKMWLVECGVSGCGAYSRAADYECHMGKSGAATLFRSRGWGTRGGTFVCPSHNRLTPRGQKVG